MYYWNRIARHEPPVKRAGVLTEDQDKFVQCDPSGSPSTKHLWFCVAFLIIGNIVDALDFDLQLLF